MSIGWSIFNADFYVAIPLKCFCICFLFFRKKNNENQAWEPFWRISPMLNVQVLKKRLIYSKVNIAW